MRTAFASKAKPGQRISHSRSYPAPIMGWVTRKALAAMNPAEAIALDNWFPKTSYLEIRGGYASHATGMTGTAKTLAVHNAMAGTSQMFCATNSGVYDVSSAGAVGASVASRTNGKHQWTMFGDGTNNWLIMCNGVDKPLYYDGSTWTAVDGATSPALTGVTTTTLIAPNVFKGRLFFIQNDTLSYWYLSAGAAGGALTEFDLSGEAKRGGYLVAMATWTVDGGDGIDDRAVFFTSKGEAIIYQGTNPSDVNAWAKVGSYFIGNPIGRGCVTQYGGDVLVLTQNGLIPLSSALQSSTVDYKMALSFNIEPTFNDAARLYSGNFGWSSTVFPAQSALIVNVPVTEDGEHRQYVMNTISKAWCRFTEWDAEDFVVFNDELYFCFGTDVRKAWSGVMDLDSNIDAYGKTAFSYFNQMGVQKHFKLVRPVLAVNGALSFLTDIDVDFGDDPISGTASYGVVAGATWDSSDWDDAYWAAGLGVVREWTTPGEWNGYCAAGKIKVSTNSLTVQWISNDYVFETGTGL